MNRSFVFGALVLASCVSTGAFADDITIDPHRFSSTRSQAEVQAELQQFKQAGVNPWSTSYNPLRSFQSTKTRAQVEQEFLASREEARAFAGEDSGSAWMAQHRTQNVGSQLAGQPIRLR